MKDDMLGSRLLHVTLQSEAATEEFGRMLAMWLRPGCSLHLSGDLGAGKSTLARALIRAVADDTALDVPSPTFSLVQSYSNLRVPILHADLYRLSGLDEASSLGLEELAGSHALVIEWPDRLNGQVFSKDHVDVLLEGRGSMRSLTITAAGKWRSAFTRNAAIEHFLAGAGVDPGSRRFLLGDASSRRYETVTWQAKEALLMDMPERSDHAIVRNGKSYSALVHLADEIGAVLAINDHLGQLGYSVPSIYQADRHAGLAIMELLRGEVHGTMMTRGDDVVAPMLSAAAVLADMARNTWPRHVPVGTGPDHVIADFDLDALLYEVDLMPTWFWPEMRGGPADDGVRQSFEEVWRRILPATFEAPPMWTLRDYHSPNLLWLPDRKGLQRTGIIDTQDAVMGNPAYDVASLAQDARVDVAEALQDRVYMEYVSLRKLESGFDAKMFARDFAILGAQRSTRLLGTFTRLSRRDGKHNYLQHRPRVARYLARNLQHPELELLRNWYEQNLPDVLALAKT